MPDRVTVSDVCVGVIDCEHRTAPPATPGAEYAYSVGTRDIRNGRILLNSTKRVDSHTYEAWTSRETPRADDVVLTREAPVGEAAWLDGKHPICLGQRTVLLRPDQAHVFPRYFHYLLLSPPIQERMHSRSSGSTVAHLNVEDIRNLPLGVLPDRRLQIAIAGVLGALDDKIALNGRMCALADELVRLRFEELAAGADLQIPLGDLGLLIRDAVRREELADVASYVGLEHIPRRRMWLPEWDTAERLISNKWQFQQRDILFGKLRPYFHKVVLAMMPGVCSTDIFVVRSRPGGSVGWLLASLSSDRVIAHASAVSDGTRMPRARWDDIASFEVPWCGEEIARRFDQYVLAMAARVAAATSETGSLSALRDLLLPKLMSGQIRVRDAEKVVEGAL